MVGAQAHAQEVGVHAGQIRVGGGASLNIQHSVDNPDSKNSIYSLNGDFGYHVTDEVSVDLIPSISGNFDGDSVIGLTGGASYHFMPREKLTPFLRGGLGFVHEDVGSGSDTSGAFLVGGGLRYFVASNVSADGSISYLAAFDDADEGGMLYGIGLSVYFD